MLAVLATPELAAPQAQPAQNAPTELWRTYPLDPHGGENQIRAGDETPPPQPAEPPPAAEQQPAPASREDPTGERGEAAASERSADGRANAAWITGIVLSLALGALVVLAFGRMLVGLVATAPAPTARSRADASSPAVAGAPRRTRPLRPRPRAPIASTQKPGRRSVRPGTPSWVRRTRRARAAASARVARGASTLARWTRACGASVGAAGRAVVRAVAATWESAHALVRAPVALWSRRQDRRRTRGPRTEPQAPPAAPGAQVVDDLVAAATAMVSVGEKRRADAGAQGDAANDSDRADDARPATQPARAAEVDRLHEKAELRRPLEHAPPLEGLRLKQRADRAAEDKVLKETAGPQWPAEKKVVTVPDAALLKEKLAPKRRERDDGDDQASAAAEAPAGPAAGAVPRAEAWQRGNVGAPVVVRRPRSRRAVGTLVRIGSAVLAKRNDIAIVALAALVSAAAGAAIALLLG